MAELTGSEVVQKITDANASFKNEVIDKTTSEVAKLAKHIETLEAQHKDDVAKMNTLITEKGGTYQNVMDEVKGLNEKMGRFAKGGVINSTKKHIIEYLGEKFLEMKDVFMEMGGSEYAKMNGQYYFGIDESKSRQVKSGTGTISEGMQTKVGSITTASLASANYIDYLPWQAGMEPIGQTRIRQFVGTIMSDYDHVQFPRANSPVGAGSFNDQTTEGNLKSQIDRGWTMQSLTLYPFAGWTAVSRQSLRNIPFLQTWLPTSLNEQLLDQEDIKFTNVIVGGATGSSSTTGVSSSVAGEVLIAYVKNLIKTKFHPTLAAVDPDKWAAVLVTKPQNYSLPNVINIDAAGNVRLLNVPVMPVNWLTGGRALVGDFAKASIIQSEGLTFRQSENGTSQDFMSNVVTFLLERTQGLALFRPDAFVTGILP